MAVVERFADGHVIDPAAVRTFRPGRFPGQAVEYRGTGVRRELLSTETRF